MISQIAGKVVQRRLQGLLIDVQGLCYEVFIPAAILQSLDGQTSPHAEIRLYTFHYHQIEPSRATPVLIGFTNEVEQEFFEQFITVSGVGPKAALRAISKPIPHIARAIDQGDVEFLKSLPGIGTQRAKEIVAKLQGKVGKFGLLPDHEIPLAPGKEDVAQEALAILTQLQYKPAEAKTMIQMALERIPAVATAEELLNEVYRQRSSARRGFTLIELLMAVIVIGLLMTFAVPNYRRRIERARGAEAYGTAAIEMQLDTGEIRQSGDY
ncbi:MAG: prepilin-type N-terminal cleavage/methylation domain-containing protein [Candidatus Omnitrophica bacterium]|nr:prepilin-type N-terminal cleavage/methylation domain-containing protein [Candidatus Omnitrophota bacterium]